MRWRCHNATDFPCASIGVERETHGEALRLNQEGTGEPQLYRRRIGVAVAARLARRISTLCQLKHIAFRIGPIAERAGEAGV